MTSAFTLPGPDLATDTDMDLQTVNTAANGNGHGNATSLPTIVIGCMDRLQEYQTLLTNLWEVESRETVRGEMVDRVVQGGKFRVSFFRVRRGIFGIFASVE